MFKEELLSEEELNDITFIKRTSDVNLIYFLINDKNEIVYVGKTKNGLSRVFNHNDKDHSEVGFVDVKEEDLDFMERYYINKFNPIYNKTNESIYSIENAKKEIRSMTEFVDYNLKQLKYDMRLLNLNVLQKSNNGRKFIRTEDLYILIKELKAGNLNE